MKREADEVSDDGEARASGEPRPSLGLSRRRLAVLVAGFVCLWLVGVFARQVGEAAAAADQADAMMARNASLQRDIDALQSELKLIQQPGFVDSTARGYMLGSGREIPFTIDPQASPLSSNAPGSTGIRPKVASQSDSPLNAWLKVLFGSE